MAGLLDKLISGVEAATPAGRNFIYQDRQNRFQHQQNELNRWQTQHQALADAIEKAAGKYQGPEGERLRDLQMEVNAARPGTDLMPYHQKYASHRQAAEKEIAQAAMQGATRPPTASSDQSSVQPVGGVSTPAPFAPLIAQPQPQQSQVGPSGGLEQPLQPLSAALPGSSPVQGGGNSSPAAFPAPAAAAAPAGAAPGADAPGAIAPLPPPPGQVDGGGAAPNFQTMGGLPGIPSVSDFLAPSLSALHNTGYIDPIIEALIPGEAALGMGQQKYQALRDHHILDLLPPAIRASIQSEALTGVNVPSFANLMKPVNVPGQIPSSSLPPGTLDAFGQLIDPKVVPFVRARQNLLDGTTEYFPMEGTTQGTVMPDDKSPTGFSRVIFDRMGNEVSRTAGATPPASMIPSVSVQSSPGAADITTTRRPQIPGITLPAAGAPRPGAAPKPAGGGGSGSGASSLPPVKSGGGGASAAIVARAKQVASGDLPLPTGRDGAAVQEYMAQHGMEVPTPMTAAAQKDLSALDPIIAEVQRVQKMVEDRPNLSKAKLGANYARYTYLNQGTEDDDLISSLSFADLRSAAQALKGTGSRAERILNKALAHTPEMGLNPPDRKKMLDLLGEMQTRLMEGRASIMADEKKSGVVGPAPDLNDTVEVVSPEGVTGTIPKSNLDKAIKRGFKRVQ